MAVSNNPPPAAREGIGPHRGAIMAAPRLYGKRRAAGRQYFTEQP
jgi:hypothetical protein